MQQVGTIGERILALRAGSSQATFAHQIGINANTLRAYEKGRAVPNADTLAALCEKTGAAPQWILMGTGPKYINIDDPPDKDGTITQDSAACPERTDRSRQDILARFISLSDSVVKMAEQNHKLTLENADLRIRLAELEARVRATAQQQASMDRQDGD